MNYILKCQKIDKRDNSLEKFEMSRVNAIKLTTYKDCYLDASKFLKRNCDTKSDLAWLIVVSHILHDYCSTHERCSCKQILDNETDYFKYLVEISCK